MNNLTVERIATEFAEAGVRPLPENACSQFHAYLELLLRWNQRLSLTSVREPEQIIQRHFVECALAAQQLPSGIKSLLDYGSGAGFPGIPVAICRPEIQVTLAEAQGRKASFLREVLRVLNLPGDVFAGRVETMPAPERFDAVSMRAVEKMELAIPEAARRVNQYLVLLITERSAAAYQALAPDLEWLPAIPVPHSEQMILSLGKRR